MLLISLKKTFKLPLSFLFECEGYHTHFRILSYLSHIFTEFHHGGHREILTFAQVIRQLKMGLSAKERQASRQNFAASARTTLEETMRDEAFKRSTGSNVACHGRCSLPFFVTLALVGCKMLKGIYITYHLM
jgi:hypothetical protein